MVNLVPEFDEIDLIYMLADLMLSMIAIAMPKHHTKWPLGKCGVMEAIVRCLLRRIGNEQSDQASAILLRLVQKCNIFLRDSEALEYDLWRFALSHQPRLIRVASDMLRYIPRNLKSNTLIFELIEILNNFTGKKDELNESLRFMSFLFDHKHDSLPLPCDEFLQTMFGQAWRRGTSEIMALGSGNLIQCLESLSAKGLITDTVFDNYVCAVCKSVGSVGYSLWMDRAGEINEWSTMQIVLKLVPNRGMGRTHFEVLKSVIETHKHWSVEVLRTALKFTQKQSRGFVTREDAQWIVDACLAHANQSTKFLGCVFQSALTYASTIQLKEFIRPSMERLKSLIDNLVREDVVFSTMKPWIVVIEFHRGCRKVLQADLTAFPAMPVKDFEDVAKLYESCMTARSSSEVNTFVKQLHTKLNKVRLRYRTKQQLAMTFVEHGKSFFGPRLW
jgi:hypothetical protein